ncbi:MAG: tetratricopeptide repeat protein [Acidobacteriota bacterium]
MPARKVRSRAVRWILGIAVFEIFNASYLAAFDTASIFYHANVVLHVVMGVPLALAILTRSLPALFKSARRCGGPQGLLLRILAVVAAVFVLSGAALAYTGTSRPYLGLLRLHIVAALTGGAMVLILVWAWSRRPSADGKARAVFRWNLAVLGTALAFPLLVHAVRAVFPPAAVRIVNPPSPPLTAMDEGGGPANPFFPSSNETPGGRYLPSDLFLDSKGSCGTSGCHPDITAQWESSMHHFSSFNNQWYRRAVEYMQDTVGTRPSKLCGGCHDMAVLLTGRMDRPIREQLHTPEANAGIGCMVCHSIVHVKDTMGQGGFVIEYPQMHKLASSKTPLMQVLHDYMVRLDPEPHRRTLLKPFHTESTPQFCSVCHKVHLDVPVNHYRWFRGFDEYDAWQTSGVSGEGARSFYYPAVSKTYTDCHMPLVASEDAGNINGRVHSHRFPGANTAIPFVNGDQAQLEATTRFLQDNSVTVDIFGVIDLQEGPGGRRRLLGPLPHPPRDDPPPVLARGGDYLVEVVTRTRNIGHRFPGGTIDAFDVWVELKAEDETGRVIFWSGWVEEREGPRGPRKGPVDPAAHSFRSFLLDGRGNLINKRNAWAARAVLYTRQIPPGASDTAHFKLRIPADAGRSIRLTAKVNYRKFSWWNTQWSYAGVRDPRQKDLEVAPGYDTGRWVFTGDTSGVAGKLKQIPDLPIIELASDVQEFRIVDPGLASWPADAPPSDADPIRRERFNDYGIGLLRQGDLRGAIAAFRKVTAIDARYADGWVNIARAQIREGTHQAALASLDRALEIDPALPKTHYFYALALKSEGRYDDAIDHLNRTLESYPRDRVVLDQLGRILFLKRDYDRAIRAFKRTLLVDPEDLEAHYNLMLCYRGKKDLENARREEILYARFKADEPSQELTGRRRRLHPEENNERQAVHVHHSTWPGKPPGPGREYARR